MFNDLDYKKWCQENDLHDLFGVSLEKYGNVDKKIKKTIYGPVDPTDKTPRLPELDDLTRLHFLTRKRKVLTVLEFGVGKSTIVFADAVKKNKIEFENFVKTNLRRKDSFRVYSVDNGKNWIKECKKSFPKNLFDFVEFSFSKVRMTTFNGRACTLYDKIPNVCPDLIYLDAPDQYSVLGDIGGISTRSADRLPMAADILVLEPFLLPGTMIVIDGRTANVRFLMNNLQRNWTYQHFFEQDIHTLELAEKPLGKFNKKHLEFAFGDGFSRF
ncbi:MAG TPA: hypothetical protein VJL36_00770 [Candidatus Paceibacterota bacterium]